MNNKVVITGMGVIAPGATGLKEFHNLLYHSTSGIKKIDELVELNFRCKIGGICSLNIDELRNKYPILNIPIISRSTFLLVQATEEALNNSGFNIGSEILEKLNPDIIIGSTTGAIDVWHDKVIPYVDKGKHLKLGSYAFEQVIFSSPSAILSGIIGTKGRVISNSLACASSTEAIAEAFFRIKNGDNKIIIAGGYEPYSKYYWSTMDAMKIITPNHNDKPTKASRPMSASSHGFVPAEGAGILILEELEHAQKRGANILAEIISSHVNSGGQRNGGSMTASNYEKLKNCIEITIKKSNISPKEIKYISGHLTGTKADSLEIKAWKEALNLNKQNFPYINSTKSLIGHTMGACGAIEIVACIIQMRNKFIHASINCEDLHPEIEKTISKNSIPFKRIDNVDIDYTIKANFGFGDVNACLLLKNIR
ncbi:MAG TPA: beta-ketoacyl-[acyl-carrier-protein] synthase family protein [Bacteroidales bacterium]|jgi:3-oxoacyl-(acyl-carrier-protein) synthase|nr:beta-ketoacyl-[acyl-carrier-protein] synthase family protein [Bacteroidales bacterium]